MAQAAPRPSPRAGRTRAAILDAAEGLFADKGFASARLEDVAEAVGIRRASIVYYFRDKRELYEAVLARVFGDFRERLAAALAPPGGLPQRIESAVAAWVDYLGERPALARILLREIADGSPDDPPAVIAQVRPFVELVNRFREETRDDPAARTGPIDPAHLASAIVGSTVFFVTAMPMLSSRSAFDPGRAQQMDAHRREVLRITRRLLGAPDLEEGA